ncbi:uncharacterized protein RCO7_11562 [Rhynchosporium graminicola]|uniref:Uncharacterized protein n=1 Tax=Rhynchosporium graminicola TaxID=2792576 RepID=A0A1E1LTR6_9HELO|nr:uncharacterized protein RCO7_11562 [Rhynchosporium commune]
MISLKTSFPMLKKFDELTLSAEGFHLFLLTKTSISIDGLQQVTTWLTVIDAKWATKVTKSSRENSIFFHHEPVPLPNRLMANECSGFQTTNAPKSASTFSLLSSIFALAAFIP